MQMRATAAKLLLRVFLLLFVSFSSDSPVLATDLPAFLEPEGSYVNANFPMEFPRRIGQFQRDKVVLYDSSGKNFSVGYNAKTPQLEIAATVYLYPSTQADALPYDPDRHFEELKSEFQSYHPDAQLALEASASFGHGDHTIRGRIAIFALRQSFFGTDPQLVWSQLYLFPYGRWFLKFRISYPDAKREKVDEEVKNFMDLLHLPIGGAEEVKGGHNVP